MKELMSEHVNAWLEAYYDGELGGKRSSMVEAHLAECETCRAELQEMEAMTALLHTLPEIEGSKPPDLFVAHVGLHLSRRTPQPASKELLRLGWNLVPLGVLGAWAAIQTFFTTYTLWKIAWQFGPGGSALENWLSGLGYGDLVDLPQVVLSFLGIGNPYELDIAVHILIPGFFGVLFLAWFAAWHISQRRAAQDERSGNGVLKVSG